MPPKRRDLSLREKQKLLKDYDTLHKCSQREAARILGISQPLLCKLLKFRKHGEVRGLDNENLNRKRMRYGKNAKVEKALFDWFQETDGMNAVISRSILRKKSKDLACNMGEKDFIPTTGWIRRWKVRYNIASQRIKCSDVKEEEWAKAPTEGISSMETVTPSSPMTRENENRTENNGCSLLILPNLDDIENALKILQKVLELYGGMDSDYNALKKIDKRIHILVAGNAKQ